MANTRATFSFRLKFQGGSKQPLVDIIELSITGVIETREITRLIIWVTGRMG
jgi:hypothetical protein